MMKKILRKILHYARYAHRPRWLLNVLLLDLARTGRWLQVPSLPLTLDIEPNNHCNFRCAHCQVTHWDKPKADLNLESFARMLGQFPRLQQIKLQGMGEPFLNKALLPMLELAEQKGIRTSTISNGSVISERIRDGLKKVSTDITFTLDGANAEVFERIRVGSSFERVVRNIASLSAERDPNRGTMRGYTVVTTQNMMELPGIVRLVAELKLDEMVFQLLISNWGKDDMEQLNAPKRTDESKQIDAQLALAQAEAARLGLPLTIIRDKFTRKKPCNWAWNSSYIASNGDVVPCCILADSDTVKMGNVFEQDFATIWNDAPYRTLRQQIRDHELPEFCTNCYSDAHESNLPARKETYQPIKIYRTPPTAGAAGRVIEG
jgi:pyrroloquinoline quinone biosynthesis protein E